MRQSRAAAHFPVSLDVAAPTLNHPSVVSLPASLFSSSPGSSRRREMSRSTQVHQTQQGRPRRGLRRTF